MRFRSVKRVMKSKDRTSIGEAAYCRRMSGMHLRWRQLRPKSRKGIRTCSASDLGRHTPNLNPFQRQILEESRSGYSRIIQVIIVALGADGCCCGIGRIVKLPVYIHEAAMSQVSAESRQEREGTYVVTSGDLALKREPRPF